MAKAVDVVVVGGGIAGCLAAVAAAERGRSVAVVEKRAYLGREVSAYNHTFVGCAADDGAFRQCPEPFRRLFRLHGGGEIVAPEGMTRQSLLAILEERGIPVLFEAEPVAATVADGTANGLLLACPAGLVWLAAGGVLDATENQNVLRTLADRPYLDKGEALVHGVFETGLPSKTVLPEAAALAAVEAALGLEPGSLRVHGSLWSDTVAVEYAYRTTVAANDGAARTRLETASRQRSVDLARHLRDNVPAFASSGVSHLAFECHVAQPGVVPSPVANVAAVPVLPWGFSLADVASAATGVEAVLDDLAIGGTAEAPTGELVGHGLRVAAGDLAFQPLADDGLPVSLLACTSPERLVPRAVLSCDVCVAGVGTGGGMAMVAAAGKGCSVVALEANRDLGGTHTTGGVVGYYAGYRGGASGTAQEEAKRLNPAGVVANGPGGISHAEYLRRKAEAGGVLLLTGTRVCGVVVEGGAVAYILAANENGLCAIRAQVAIDATGDGDLAALAGAEYEIGDAHDGMVQSYSMWGKELYPTPSFLAQRYLTDPGIFHPDVYSERLRAIAVAHRDNSPHHISPMLTPREGRRIVGEHRLTMADILSQRIFPDALAVACTQTDSHAFASSDFDRLGGAGGGAHLRVRIPYGAFLPKGIDCLLVAAKAISGERDATCFCRMNADIKNAGWAVGLAAAEAARNGIGVRDIDLPALQEELKRLRILPDWAFATETGKGAPPRLATLAEGGFAALVDLLYVPAAKALPLLEARYAEALGGGPADPGNPEQVQLCLALAWHGSVLGGDLLSTLLERAVAAGQHVTLPRIRSFRQGIVAGGEGRDDYPWVNRLLVMAGRAGSREVVAPLARLVAETPGLGEPLPRTMPYDERRKDIVSEPFYSRLRNVAFAVERQADAALVPAMEALLRREGVAGHSVALGECASPRYMLAHLEIWLARAAARCGSRLERRSWCATWTTRMSSSAAMRGRSFPSWPTGTWAMRQAGAAGSRTGQLGRPAPAGDSAAYFSVSPAATSRAIMA